MSTFADWQAELPLLPHWEQDLFDEVDREALERERDKADQD